MENESADSNILYRDVFDAPFDLYGFYKPQGLRAFIRMPLEVAKNVSESVATLCKYTTGGRVRFKTNSHFVSIIAELEDIGQLSIMPLSGLAGFDLYLNKNGYSTYYKSFVPPYDIADKYSGTIQFDTDEERDITINFPLYSGVKKLQIGLEGTATIAPGAQYIDRKPILYYGSSITHGCCASRPGNAYPAMISRNLNCDYINLGFSGSAKGEVAIADYIAGLDVSVFVCDYDYNAPNKEHLENTYPYLYGKFRESQPNTPVIFVTNPDVRPESDEDVARREVIHQKYIQAVMSGDRNIYFIDGYSLFGGAGRGDCTVDACHPNDLGFYRMADVIGDMVKKALYR
jgi:hypothetical protein